MFVLGIESSCDDTSVALLDCSTRGCFVMEESTASQIDIHKKYGGVVPELAGRAHAEKIVPLIEMILTKQNKPDVIAVTAGPGLITGLLVGVEAAKTLSYLLNIPLAAVNHLEGHIYSTQILNSKPKTPDNLKIQKINNKQEIIFPALALIASGGHTELILMADHGQYQLLGATKDDAAGECFDKIAKLLGLPYPGGPQISKLGRLGKPKTIDFPRPMLDQANYDFSFSGLKTAALYWLKKHTKYNLNNFCASFEQAIIDVLVTKTIKAATAYQPKTIILAGGVSANQKLRLTLNQEVKKINQSAKYLMPASQYSMDNAAMIAVAGYYRASQKKYTSWQDIQANPNWKIND